MPIKSQLMGILESIKVISWSVNERRLGNFKSFLNILPPLSKNEILPRFIYSLSVQTD
jgi:hypothetical protein